MDDQPHAKEEKRTFTVLVTGANSGLGFSLCCRLIEEFLFTRPQSQTLHLLFSTRDAKKGADTLRRLSAHLQSSLREANGKVLGISLLLEARVKLEGVLVDLLQLQTVKSLAEQLLRRGERLDAVVWNAGIAGWSGLHWGKAVWTIVTDLVQATTYPIFMNCHVGLATKPQVTDSSEPEPKLGQVFTANVFGHYLLTHWLAPLMHHDTRIVWISSISAVPHTFSIDDIQGLESLFSYESSKRLTDFLVLTSQLPSTKPYIKDFLPAPSDEARPRMYVTHPGVIQTSITGLHWFFGIFMIAAFYLARWIGSPWHPIDPYKGAVSPAFAVLSSHLPQQEFYNGKGKWGSATSVKGDERVARTEVGGWGYCGKPGVMPKGSVSTHLFRGREELNEERRQKFEVIGRQAWKEMEEMRVEWEQRLGPVSQVASIDL